MPKVSRGRRAEIARSAHHIRQRGQLSGWSVGRIATAIVHELPEVTRLEAWRFAYGWTRSRVIEGIAAMYVTDGLAVPAVNSSMVCRWEHGELLPSDEYVTALCRLYGVTPEELGLAPRGFDAAPWAGHGGRGRGQAMQLTGSAGYQRTEQARPPASDRTKEVAALTAVWESIRLGLEVEGSIGGSLTLEQFEQAVECYALNYSAFAPRVLAAEVHRCRVLVAGLLGQARAEPMGNSLRRVAGWLSALLGNLAFHVGDHPAARIHLRTAQQVGSGVGDARLVCWSLGAQSMVARHQHRYATALDLACQALEHTTTPLMRAQVLAWARLPALAGLGCHHRSEAARVIAAAYREMDADPKGQEPGRFGFDPAEFELHVAEAHLLLGDATQAAVHAQASLEHTATGRPGWAAATLLLAVSDARRHRPDQATDRAMAVLDTIPFTALRETARQRLALLDGTLCALDKPGSAMRDLHERLQVSAITE